MRRHAHKPTRWGELKGRYLLDVSLSAPPRDHAGQIEALRDAVAKTAGAIPSPHLGLMVRPIGLKLDLDALLGVPASRFKIVRCDIARDWSALYAASRSTPVFDPFDIAFHGEFGRILRSRKFEKVICGIKACRAAVADES